MALRELYGLKYHDVAYEHVGKFVKYRLFFYYPVGTGFDEALDWLKRRVERTDVIAASDPQWVYLRIGMKAVLPPFELNGKKAQQLVDTVPVKYLIAETAPQILGLGMYYRFTSALLRENSTNWKRIWRSSNDSVEIYGRSRVVGAAYHRDAGVRSPSGGGHWPGAVVDTSTKPRVVEGAATTGESVGRHTASSTSPN